MTWIMLCDLNGDGTSEILTEEDTGRGTGVLTRAFALYLIDSIGIAKAWTAESSDVSAQQKHAYVRVDGRRLYYLRGFGAAGSEKVFELRGRKLLPVPTAAKRP